MHAESTERMTNNRTIKIYSLIVAGMLGTALTSQGNVLYQSDFTGATLADAGLATTPGILGTWILNTTDDQVEGTGSSNSRVNLYTLDSWQENGGFTLDVTFRAEGTMTRYDFGIVDGAYTISSSGAWLTSSLAGAYGVGFSATIGATDGLFFHNGSSVATLSTAQGNIGTGWQTMSITVTPTSWSYSLNGQPPTTGLFGTPFDTGRSYRFTAHAQRVHETKFFSNITLTPVIPIPTLSEWGMIILVGLVVLVMGRRMLKKPPEAAVAASSTIG